MSSSVLLRVAVLACALSGLGGGGAEAATTLSPDRLDDPLVGGDSCKPKVAGKCSLRGALADAEGGDTIELGSGTYVLSLGQLVVDEKVSITGAGPAATTIRQTTPGSRVIDAHTALGLTLSGLTITGGNLVAANGEDGTGVGGNGTEGQRAEAAGILGSGAGRLTDVVITGNTAFGGDGGDGAAGSSSVPGGEGGDAGRVFGVGVRGFSPLELLRVAITDNVGFPGEAGAGGNAAVGGDAGKGGRGGQTSGAGVGLGFSTMAATDSLIAGNVAHTTAGGHGGNSGPLGSPGEGGQGEAGNGAGIFANAEVELTNVTIAGNVSDGAIGGSGGNSQSAGSPTPGGDGGNASSGGGGGISAFNGADVSLASVTIAGNRVGAAAPGAGGGGSNGGGGGDPGFVFPPRAGNVFVNDAAMAIRDTLIADGIGPGEARECTVQSNGTLTSLGHNLIGGGDDQCIVAPGAGDRLGAAANLGPLADNGGPTATLALLPGSAAIDAGPATCPDLEGKPLATDQRGAPRLSPCDIGAYELQPVAPGAPGGPGAGAGPSPIATAKLSGLKLSPRKLRNGQRAKVAFSLDLPAEVSFSIKRKLPGVKSGRSCVRAASTAGAAEGKPCVRLLAATGAPKGFAAAAGANRRDWKPRGLAPGRYKLTATPAGGTPRGVGFRILPKPPSP